MHQRWWPIVLLVTATLLIGLFPVDRDLVQAVQRGDQLATALRYTAALRSYQSAEERYPGSPLPALRLADVYLRQGRHDEAWTAYVAAIQRGGPTDQVLEGLARLYAAQQSPAWSISYLQRLLERRPDRGDLWARLGEAALGAGEQVAAQEAFAHALELGITAAERQRVHDRLGIMCAEGDVGSAIAHLDQVESGPDPDLAEHALRLTIALRALEQPDEPALARARLGEALMRHGELSLAERQFQAAVDIEPDYVDGHAYLGHVLSLLGENERAVHHLERAIALEPAYVLPRYLLGMHYVRSDQFVTGRTYLEQAHDLDPSNPAICAAVADTHIRAEEPQYGVAEQWLHAAVDNAPEDIRFHLLLAHFYVDYAVDPATRGLAVAKFAASLEPRNSEAQETLGWAYHLAGQSAQALEALTRARDLAPDEPRIYYRLAEVHRALRELALARQLYQQAIDLDWNGLIGERARQAMDQ